MRQALAIGIDVGGTKLAAGLVASDGEVLHCTRRATPGEPTSILAAIVDVVGEIERHYDITGLPVGLGIAAIVDGKGIARWAPNLPLEDEPVRDRLSTRLAREVFVDNDASVATWAEYRVGAGWGARGSMVMLTLGTGVGGGLVIDGQLRRGSSGFAGEFGHMIVAEGGPWCPCGNHGCLEALASGNAIGRVAEEALAAGAVPASSILHEVRPATGKTVTVAAHAGDEFALQVLAQCGFWLGVGVASLVNAFDPEMVIVGGGAIQAGDLLLEPARKSLAGRLIGRGHRPIPPLVKAHLGDSAGFIGAALLALPAPP